ncbi:replication-relaxation family protein [Paenibacillus gansuensis]|uniref:Replication-relaxation family protein n=1 Tax=Paenibacillus gansuensis TaxID=306542 RepID=A0ABW5PIM6_9BACL
MENLVSPLIKPSSNTVLPERPQWDDPYAFLLSMSPLAQNDYWWIEQKIKAGWITDRDIQLVRFLSVHRWIVLDQIRRIFFPDVKDFISVRKRVSRLIRYGLLRRIKWTSYSGGTERNRPSIYELGDSGADILKYMHGISLGNRDPRHQKPATMLYRSRYVITNELYIKLREAFNMVHFEFHPTLKWKDIQVIPTAKYVLRSPKGREMPFYLICHREDEKWVKTVRFQAAFFKEYIANVEPQATIVVLVSNDEKALLANKIAEQEGASSFTWFVTDKDLLYNEVHLSQGFFFFEKGEKTYYDLR